MRTHHLAASGTLLLAVGLGLAPSCAGADYATGLDAWNDGRPGLAHERWTRCAHAGSVDCQYALGRLVEEGHGAPPSPREALLWYRRAAEQDHPEAMMRLGFLFAIGDEDLDQDPVESWAWFARAAALGVPEAATHRERVGALLTEDERRKAERRADELSIRYHLQK